ncbi:protein of unknown function (plasmid) [Cupriavidus neocaledonicus]|uniref:Uncharacterized protein n=1 Tax=Cupriavidus neocaledonicus TaxID=1040979 RepID=A0A375HW22_9BURK|nr:protein of unknown function [Cupriavidus neocaledonicus]
MSADSYRFAQDGQPAGIALRVAGPAATPAL